MEIVGAFACSHAGLIVTRENQAPREQRDEVFSAYQRMGHEIAALEPDAIILIGTDHGRIYALSHVPQFTIGVGPIAESIGDADLPKETIQINQRVAQTVLENMLSFGVDLAYSESIQIDHSFIAPL